MPIGVKNSPIAGQDAPEVQWTRIVRLCEDTTFIHPIINGLFERLVNDVMYSPQHMKLDILNAIYRKRHRVEFNLVLRIKRDELVTLYHLQQTREV